MVIKVDDTILDSFLPLIPADVRPLWIVSSDGIFVLTQCCIIIYYKILR